MTIFHEFAISKIGEYFLDSHVWLQEGKMVGWSWCHVEYTRPGGDTNDAQQPEIADFFASPGFPWIQELLQNQRHRKSDNMILGKLMLIDDSIGLHEMHLDMVWKRVPSGKRLHNYGNSPCYSWVYQLFRLGNGFHSKLLVYQRVKPMTNHYSPLLTHC